MINRFLWCLFLRIDRCSWRVGWSWNINVVWLGSLLLLRWFTIRVYNLRVWVRLNFNCLIYRWCWFVVIGTTDTTIVWMKVNIIIWSSVACSVTARIGVLDFTLVVVNELSWIRRKNMVLWMWSATLCWWMFCWFGRSGVDSARLANLFNSRIWGWRGLIGICVLLSSYSSEWITASNVPRIRAICVVIELRGGWGFLWTTVILME